MAGVDAGGVPVPGRRQGLLALALVLALFAALALGRDTAAAETPEDAHAAAHAAARRVEALQARVDAALRSYDEGLTALASSVAVSLDSQRDAAAAAGRAHDHRAAATNRVRAFYMAGGAPVVYASVLEAHDPSDLFRRIGYARSVLDGEAAATDRAVTVSDHARSSAAASSARVDAQVQTAGQVADRYQVLQDALAQQQAALDRLSARASALTEARAAARRLRASRLAAERVALARAATTRATGVPPDSLRLYHGAATTCPGLPWTVLAAIGQVESAHGRNTGPSSAGAMGPMQFLPSTFATYGVDGDGDGDVDINDPADSVYSAAGYLCANGAGQGGTALEGAIWHYNHADWYVRMVLRVAAQLAGA